MLQIISGKFYDSDDKFHNDAKGILYSNASLYGVHDLDFVKLESVEVFNNISSYVVSYDNQLQNLGGKFILMRTGDDVIIRHLKNILSFSLNCFFDEDKSVVENICRQKGNKKGHESLPSEYLQNTLQVNRIINPTEVESCQRFFKQLLGLRRSDYINLINCLVAYNASIKLLNEDINLAYSMLVYCLESLVQNYDRFEPSWEDYNQNKKIALEKIFSELPSEAKGKIKEILIKDEQLKLATRFRNFIIKYLDDSFFLKIKDNKVVCKDDLEVALSNAYIIRSKYAHMLKPILKQLTMADISSKSDYFDFAHDVFLTYSGLLRVVRTIINNFVFSLETVSAEQYSWNNDLPGVVQVQLAPYYWIGNNGDDKGNRAIARLEGLIRCLVDYRNNIPPVDDIVEEYFKNLDNMKAENKHAAYIFSILRSGLIKNDNEERRLYYNERIEKYSYLLKECCIYNLILPAMLISFNSEIAWDSAECERVVEEYNKKKHKENNIRLPFEIETIIYINIANSYIGESDEKRELWMKRAHYNMSNTPSVQKMIEEKMQEKEALDIKFIWDEIIARFKTDS